MKSIDLSNVQEAAEYEKIAVGGYVCRIITVQDLPEKEYLKIEYDIAEGQFKGYYQELFGSMSFWGGNLIRSYKEKALPFFKAFITAVEKSNNGYKFDSDEAKLRGKLVGIVLGEEEYKKKDGTIGKRLYAASIRSVDEIRKGNFEVPELKKLKTKPNEDFKPISDTEDDDLPF